MALNKKRKQKTSVELVILQPLLILEGNGYETSKVYVGMSMAMYIFV